MILDESWRFGDHPIVLNWRHKIISLHCEIIFQNHVKCFYVSYDYSKELTLSCFSYHLWVSLMVLLLWCSLKGFHLNIVTVKAKGPLQRKALAFLASGQKYQNPRYWHDQNASNHCVKLIRSYNCSSSKSLVAKKPSFPASPLTTLPISCFLIARSLWSTPPSTTIRSEESDVTGSKSNSLRDKFWDLEKHKESGGQIKLHEL